MRRIVVDKETVLILGLLDGEVGARMLQFRGKGDRRGAGNSGEVPAQVGCKIHDHLPGQPGILIAEAVDACHGVVNEMRPHLRDHDTGLLIGDFLLLQGNFPLMAQVLLHLLGQDQPVHGHGGDNNADIDQRENIDKQVRDQSNGHRQDRNEVAEEGSAGKLLPAPYGAREIEKQDDEDRQRNKRVQGSAEIQPFRRNRGKTVHRDGADKHNHIGGPQAEDGVQEPGRAEVFPAAVQQVNRQHRHRHRKKQGFKKENGINDRHRGTIILDDHFEDTEKHVYHQHDKIAFEEAPVPAVGPGHDPGEPQPHQAQQKRRAEQEEVEKIDPVDHSSVPPVESG